MATKCKNCGAVVSDTANYCTECGTKIERKNTDNGNEMFKGTIANLRKTITEFVQKQYENPKDAFSVSFDFDKMEDNFVDEENEDEENAIMTEIAGGITNCCFLPDSGDEVFPGTMNDGKVHLMLEYLIDEREDYSSRVLPIMFASSVFEKFIYIKTDFKNRASIHHFYADFGEDIKGLINVCGTLITDFLGNELKETYHFEVLSQEDKDAAHNQAVETAKYQVKKLGLKAKRIK